MIKIQITKSQIEQLEKPKRVHLINSLAGFKSVSLVGTSDKKGNKNLRKAMHLPALTAIRHNPRYKAVFARLVAKHGIKMKATVAVQRKLLEMIYTIYKTGKAYDKHYLPENEIVELINEHQTV